MLDEEKLKKKLTEKQDLDPTIREEIFRSQKQWQATIDAVTDYIFVTDRNHVIRRANISFAHRVNKHPREIIGLKADQLLGIDIKLPDRVYGGAPDHATQTSEEISIGDDIYLVSVFPAMYEENEVFVCIMKDISEMKRLRDQLYNSYKLTSIGLLVSGVAHEINNPLTGILGFTELLRMKVEDEGIQKELGKIYKAAERCKIIVESLLCFSRQQPPHKTLEYINEVIDRTLDLRSYWIKKYDIEIVRDFRETPLSFIDSQQVQQVIMNLLLNAENAVVRSGRKGKIVFSTSYNETDRKIVFSIADNGTGISAENMSKIFDPFFTTKPVNEGTGLGLSISYGIISEHKGTLEVESVQGEGTTFVIELPVK